MDLLQIKALSVTARLPQGTFPVLNKISLEIATNETLALIGESGSGKTMLALATLGLLPSNLTARGEIQFLGKNIIAGAENELINLRGRQIAMIFQNAKSAFNPTFRVGAQLVEVMQTHLQLSKQQAKRRALELFAETDLSDPDTVYHAYPHQLSGGMAQRAMIAMGLSCSPKLVIADEPTSALDTTTQRQIIDLLQKMQKQHGFALWVISHDLALVAEIADRIAVMKDGRIVESGTTTQIINNPTHPYTQLLLGEIQPNLINEHMQEVHEVF